MGDRALDESALPTACARSRGSIKWRGRLGRVLGRACDRPRPIRPSGVSVIPVPEAGASVWGAECFTVRILSGWWTAYQACLHVRADRREYRPIRSVRQIIPWAGHVNYASSKGGCEHDDADPRPGAGPEGDPGQRGRTRHRPHADQPRGLVHPRGRGRPPAPDPVPPRGRTGRHRQRRRRRGVRPARLRRRHHPLRRRRTLFPGFSTGG